MFEYQTSKIGQWLKHMFVHPQLHTGFAVVPERGGIVLEIWFAGNQILDTYETAKELDVLKWFKSALLFPFPNRLKDGNYIWQNKTYTWPINNAATQNAIHGMVRDVVFYPTRITLTPTHAEVTCRYIHTGDHPSFPFPFELDISYKINTRNKFFMSFQVRNTGGQPIPAGFGWHPYFRLGTDADQTKLKLPRCQQVLIDDRMIPTGERKAVRVFQKCTAVKSTEIDTCFLVEGVKTYKLSMQGSNQQLTFHIPTRGFPYFQVFVPPHRKSIALEPMTCNIDAFNNRNGLHVISPGKVWKEGYSLEWSALDSNKA